MSKSLYSSMPALAFAVISIAIIFSAATAFADSVSVNFENPPYTLGDINGQDGWSMTGPYDVEVGSSLGTAGFGAQSLRISNAVTTGAFGDQTFAPELVNGAGESGVGAESHFEAQFDISSTDLNQQPGLAISVSPDDGNGSRMSYLSFVDDVGGIRVTFYDVTDAGPIGTVASFNPTDLGLISRTPHTIKFVMDFVDGPANDVVEIWIDGALVHTGTSWEDYYRYDPEQAGNGNQLSPVDTLIFRAGGTAAPATDDHGFLFDNLTLTSSTPVPTPVNPRNISSTSFKISVANRGSVINTTQADSHTGQNLSLGSLGGLGGLGGSVTSTGSENNGGATAGNGGNGGNSSDGGLVTTGNASADASSGNSVNGTEVAIESDCGCGGEINGLTVEADVDNDAPNALVNIAQARGRTGQNLALGSAGGNAGNGGAVSSGAGSESNGGAAAGTGGSGGSGGLGGAVGTGHANSTSSTFNQLNATLFRVRF